MHVGKISGTPSSNFSHLYKYFIDTGYLLRTSIICWFPILFGVLNWRCSPFRQLVVVPQKEITYISLILAGLLKDYHPHRCCVLQFGSLWSNIIFASWLVFLPGIKVGGRIDPNGKSDSWSSITSESNRTAREIIKEKRRIRICQIAETIELIYKNCHAVIANPPLKFSQNLEIWRL